MGSRPNRPVTVIHYKQPWNKGEEREGRERVKEREGEGGWVYMHISQDTSRKC